MNQHEKIAVAELSQTIRHDIEEALSGMLSRDMERRRKRILEIRGTTTPAEHVNMFSMVRTAYLMAQAALGARAAKELEVLMEE